MNSKKTVAILHYSYPPIIGGVEFVMREQAKVLAKNRCRVKIITGRGESREKEILMELIPEIGSTGLKNKTINGELNNGIVSERFRRLKEVIYQKVKHSLKGVDICIIHNVMTMHFNLALTSALNEIVNEFHQGIKFYFWCHDAALINPDYKIKEPSWYPYNLLSNFNQNAAYIAISEWRKNQLSQLFGVSESLIKVIPNGIDIKSFLRISDSVWKMASHEKIFDEDLVMLFPSRIVKRKNYELAIRITEEIVASGKRCKLLVTSPFDPHNSDSKEYYDYLQHLIKKLGLENHVLFLIDLKDKYGLDIGYHQLRDLYKICDLLLITSSQEGFGIPLLEAAAMKMPIACTRIPSLLEVAKDKALFFEPDENPSDIAQKIVDYLEAQPTYFMFRRVISKFSWEAIYRDYLKDLLD
ncbi:glycosyltransferase family 4 protein [Candidatus Aerophobetes bacterium]|nr:glycosyltransferase family 4 protein [Candidatus Aerophobetes bacterium]